MGIGLPVAFMRGRCSAAWLLAVCACLCAGCGSNDGVGRCAIPGKVTLHGSPLDTGLIQFMPSQAQTVMALAAGATIAEGAYSIPQDRGLPAGVYKVLISSAGSAAAADAQPGAIAAPREERIPPEYNVKSEQTVTVVAGQANTFDFDIP